MRGSNSRGKQTPGNPGEWIILRPRRHLGNLYSSACLLGLICVDYPESLRLGQPPPDFRRPALQEAISKEKVFQLWQMTFKSAW